MTFEQRLFETAHQIGKRLECICHDFIARGVPARVAGAMSYALLSGGKRLRPFLVLESAQVFDVPVDRAIETACAIECIHCYSLVHDDLPSMDNDQLRRGKPTVWSAYDEWTAILAGDALQSLAFEIVSADDARLESNIRVRLTRGLAQAAGAQGMVGGQALDLAAEKRNDPRQPNAAHIKKLQAMKTGALIRFSCEAGAILAGDSASADDHAAIASFGEHLGYAFQIADDLLDAQGDAATLGKAVAKDAQAGKATLVSLLGIDEARAQLIETHSKALAALAPFGEKTNTLRAAADFVVNRKS